MTVTAKAERLMAAIEKNAVERRSYEKKLEALRTKADTMIVQAHQEGVPKSQLAKVARMTRQTVYMILMRAKAVA